MANELPVTGINIIGNIIGATSSSITLNGAAVSVPSGGTTGQVLSKTASGFEWVDVTIPESQTAAEIMAELPIVG